MEGPSGRHSTERIGQMRIPGRFIVVLAMATLLALAASGAVAAGRTKYQGTLAATPNVLQAGDRFDVSGCGYDTAAGNVIVGFTGGSWGSSLDANGCFTIAGIPALSGDTLPAGTYEVGAYQYIHNKWTETGETTVTVIP
jgi:hypothetical protein